MCLTCTGDAHPNPVTYSRTGHPGAKRRWLEGDKESLGLPGGHSTSNIHLEGSPHIQGMPLLLQGMGRLRTKARQDDLLGTVKPGVNLGN